MLRIDLNLKKVNALIILKVTPNPRLLRDLDNAAWELEYSNTIKGYINSDYQYWEY